MTLDKLNHDLLARRDRRQKYRVFERAIYFALAVAAIVLAMLIGKPAKAQIFVTPTGTGAYGISGPRGTTVYAPLGSADTRIIRVPPHEEDANANRAWESYCNPSFRYDALGVTHYVFAKPGCEFGKDHD